MSRPVNTVIPQSVVTTAQSAPYGFTVNPLTGQTFRVIPAKSRSNDYLRLQREYDAARANLVRQMRDLHLTYNISSKTITDRDGRVVSEPEVVRTLRTVLDSAKTALKQYKSANAGEFAPTRRGTAQSRALQRRRRFERLVENGRLVLNRQTGRYERALSQPSVAVNPGQGVEQKVRLPPVAAPSVPRSVMSTVSYSSAALQSSATPVASASSAVQTISASAPNVAPTSTIARFQNFGTGPSWADDADDEHYLDQEARLDSVESHITELKSGMSTMMEQLSKISGLLLNREDTSNVTISAAKAERPAVGHSSSSSNSSQSGSVTSGDDGAPLGT